MKPNENAEIKTKRMTLSFYEKGSFWLKIKVNNGEGMQIFENDLDELLYSYFMENF